MYFIYAFIRECRRSTNEKNTFYEKESFNVIIYSITIYIIYIIAYIFVTLFINILDRHKKKKNYNCFYRFLYTFDFINTLL